MVSNDNSSELNANKNKKVNLDIDPLLVKGQKNILLILLLSQNLLIFFPLLEN